MAPRDEKTVDNIFAGCLDNLPPLSSKVVSIGSLFFMICVFDCQVVRIFTSSTFTDMLMERNTLMEWVYPKIKEYCKERHGLEFQVKIQTFSTAPNSSEKKPHIYFRWWT